MFKKKLQILENNKLLFYVKWLIVSLFVILVAVQSGKSFVLDEIDFPSVSNATSQSGRPVYYHNEENQQHTGTYHPTLYINSLALFIRAFGFNETTIRFFGIICVLISAFLLIQIFRQLTKKHEGLETLFLGLFLLNPYTLSSATLPDIDPTVLPVLLLLFIYMSLKYVFQKKQMDNKVVLILGLLFAAVLWTKLTTPLILPPFLACLAFIMTKDYKKSLLFTVKISALGLVAFLISYFLYCILLGLSPTYTYTFLLESFTKGTSSEGPLVGVMHNLENLRYFVYWPTIPVIGILGVSLIGIMLDKTRNQETQIKKLLMLTAVLTTLFYIALISPFGGYFKYPFPVFGLLLLSVIFFYDRYLLKTKVNVLYAAAALLFGYLVEKVFWNDSMFLSQKPFGYMTVLAVVIIACYILLVHTRTRKIASSAFILLIAFAVGFQLCISRVQAVAPYPTKYLYGQTGMDEAVSYLKANTEDDEIIWSMKDVGQYVNHRFYESYPYYFEKSLEPKLINMIRSGEVRYYVATTGIGQDNIDYYTDIRDVLDEYTVKEAQFGNFIIYKAKSQLPQ